MQKSSENKQTCAEIFKQVLKDISTGIDGVSYNNIKIFTNIAVMVMLFIALVIVFRLPVKDIKEFPWLGFSGGLTAILFGGKAGEAVGQFYKTEPPAQPATMKTEDNKENQNQS